MNAGADWSEAAFPHSVGDLVLVDDAYRHLFEGRGEKKGIIISIWKPPNGTLQIWRITVMLSDGSLQVCERHNIRPLFE